MALEIFSLFGSIFVDNEEANKSISKTDEKAQGVAGTLAKGVGTAAKWGAAVVGGATVAAGALFKVANDAAGVTDRVDKLSQKIGISREGFQEWEFILSQSGTDIEKLQVGMKTMVQRMDETAAGSEKATEMFGKLGVSVTDATGGLRSQEDVFNDTVRALQNMPEGAEKSRLAFELFGKAGMELGPLLNDTNESLDGMKNMAHDMGMVLSDDAVDAGVAFTDTMDQVQRTLKALMTNIGASVMPMFNDFLQMILGNMPRIQDILSKVFGALQKVVERVLPLLMDVVEDALPPIIDMLTSLIEDVVPIIIDLVSDIIGNILPALIEYNQNIIGNILPVFIDLFKFIIEEVLPPVIELLMEIIEAVLPPFMKLFSEVISKLLPPLINLFKRLIEAVLPILIKVIDLIVEKVLPPFMELFVEIVDLILPPVIDTIEFLADEILPKLVDVFEWMSPLIEGWVNLIADVIGIAVSIIKGDWEGAWDGIKNYVKHWIETVTGLFDNFKEVFSDIFKKIKEIVKGIWDGIVEDIKNSINFIIKSINVFIDGVNKIKIPDWVPDWMGGGKGINLPTIPLLAKGGEILERGKAIVGEAGAEMLELPKGAKVKPLGHESGGIVITGNNFYGVEDGTVKKIARELAKMVDEKKRKGLVTA